MKKSVRLYITGTVQKLFFRNFIKQNAEELGVKGFMRYLEDARVEIFIEGDGEQVDKMRELCKKGPRHAKIRKVEEKRERFQDFREFKILHI